MVHASTLERPGSALFLGSERAACAGATATSERTRHGRLSLALLAADAPQVELIWRTLEAAARPVYFLSWGWISTWLAALPAEAQPELAVSPGAGEGSAERRGG